MRLSPVGLHVNLLVPLRSRAKTLLSKRDVEGAIPYKVLHRIVIFPHNSKLFVKLLALLIKLRRNDYQSFSTSLPSIRSQKETILSKRDVEGAIPYKVLHRIVVFPHNSKLFVKPLALLIKLRRKRLSIVFKFATRHLQSKRKSRHNDMHPKS